MENCEVEQCFEKLVGVYGCHNEGECKLYVNDLEGISGELLNHITDSERKNYKEVYDKALRSALGSLKFDIEQAVLDSRNSAEFEGIVYTSEAGEPVYPVEYKLVKEKYLGVVVTIAKSSYVEAVINGLSIKVRNDATVTPIIYDISNQTELSRGADVELLGEEVSLLDFDYRYSCTKGGILFVGIELKNTVEVAVLECNKLTNNYNDPCEAVCGNGNEDDYRDLLNRALVDNERQFSIYSVVAVDLRTPVHKEGVVCLDANLVCSMNLLLCENASILADAVVYKVAHNILMAKMDSKRQNMYAQSEPEKTVFFAEKANKEYARRLKLIAPKVTKGKISLCWACGNSGLSVVSKV